MVGIQNIQKSQLAGTITIESCSDSGTRSSINSESSNEEGWLILTSTCFNLTWFHLKIALLAQEAFQVQLGGLGLTRDDRNHYSGAITPCRIGTA